MWLQQLVVLIWAPYDNDLAFAGLPIVQAAEAASIDVAVQLDLPGSDGMVRYAGGEQRTIPSDASSDPAAFTAFLDWAADHYEAERYAVVILDHGGAAGELARDDDPPGWLQLDDVAAALASFDAKEAGHLELVVLQVCGKATLEAAWALRGTADQLLASAVAVAAPNPWFQNLGPGPLAPQVVAGMGQDRFVQLTCIDLEKAAELPARFAAPLSVDTDALAARVWTYAGDAFVDLDAVTLPDDLRGWIDQELICGSWQSAGPDARLLEGFPEGGARIGLWLPGSSLPNDTAPVATVTYQGAP